MANLESSILHKPVKSLNPEVARKIAAGEVIDRPCAIIRELMDNAVDSGAKRICIEIENGGIEKIRVIDDGSGMTEQDLYSCARPHATSKITDEKDLLNLTTLGFRGEALSSMAAVSRLEITSGGNKMRTSLTEDHIITKAAFLEGTIVQTAGLFENFPARRMFLKRPSSEALLCKNMFEEKAIPRPDLSFSFTSDGKMIINLPQNQTLTQRFVQALGFKEPENLFYEIGTSDTDYSFRLVIGEPSVIRDNRKNIYIYVNGRRIQEYSLMQAIEYGCQGYFPNGSHPVACLFLTINPSLVDFNIHPAKREARFKDIGPVHHSISSTVKNFFKQYTIKNIVLQNDSYTDENLLNNTNTAQNFNTEFIDNNLNITSDSRSKFFGETKFFDKNYKIDHTNLQYKDNTTDHSFFSKRLQNNNLDNLLISTTERLESNNLSPTDYSEELSPEKKDKLNANDRSFHYIGTALGTFIIVEYKNALYIIDQHAADERIRFNELMAHIGEKQQLLIPYTINTASESDDNYLSNIKNELEEAGFTCRNCGNGKWEFSSVPIRWKGTESDLSHDLLDKRINPSDIAHAIAASTACRSSVMDGTILDSGTASRLAIEALNLPDPHCPHGRPVYTSITREQLFSLVKRT